MTDRPRTVVRTKFMIVPQVGRCDFHAAPAGAAFSLLLEQTPMIQAELDRQIARLTGEDLHEIRRLGFSVSGPECNDLNLESDWEAPQVLDWDETSPGQGPAPSNLDKLVGWAA